MAHFVNDHVVGRQQGCGAGRAGGHTCVAALCGTLCVPERVRGAGARGVDALLSQHLNTDMRFDN